MMKKIIICFILITLFGCAEKWHSKYGIERMDSDAVPKLIVALSDEDAKVRGYAIKFLNRLKEHSQDSLPQLMDIAQNDPSEINRISALRAFSNINTDKESVVLFLNKILETEKSESVIYICNNLITDNTGKSGSFEVVLSNNGHDSPPEKVIINYVPSFRHYSGYRNIDMVRNSGILPLSVEIINDSSKTAARFLDNDSNQRSITLHGADKFSVFANR